MAKTRAEVHAIAAQKRQAVLDYLHANGPTKLRTIAAALGMHPDDLSPIVCTLYRWKEVRRADTAGRIAQWEAVATTTHLIEPRRAQPAAPKIEPPAEDPPGLRRVKLLDKPASQTGRGGQCASTHYGSLQCNFAERRMVR